MFEILILLKKYFLNLWAFDGFIEESLLEDQTEIIKKLNENDDVSNKNETSNNFSYKKILCILLIILFLTGSFYLFYTMSINFNEENLEFFLNKLSKTVNENTFQKIDQIIKKILLNPSQKKTGIYLLEIIKLCKGIDSTTVINDEKKFQDYLDKIIEILSK